MFRVLLPAAVALAFVAGRGVAQPLARAITTQPAIPLGKATEISFKEKDTPKKPGGVYMYTVAIPNKVGEKLYVEMESESGLKVECQVAVLDPNRRRGVQLPGAKFESQKHTGGLKWTMPEGMPENTIYLQFQSYSEAKFQVFVDWEDAKKKGEPAKDGVAGRGGPAVKPAAADADRLSSRIAELEKRVEALEQEVKGLRKR